MAMLRVFLLIAKIRFVSFSVSSSWRGHDSVFWKVPIMKREMIAAAVIALSVMSTALAAPTGATAGSPYADIMIEAQLDTALAAARRGDAQLVALSLDTAMSAQIYKQLSPNTQHEVAFLYGMAELQLGHLDDAHHGFVLASENPMAGLEDWYQRLAIATTKNDAADAYLAFKQLRDHWPSFVSRLSLSDAIDLDVNFAALKTAPEARRVFGETLARQDWHPPDPMEDPSTVWLPYAVSLAESGRADDALAIAGRITDPMSVIAMRADKRFDAAIAKDPDVFDPMKRGRAWLALMQKISKDAPHRLEAKIALARAFHKLSENKQALEGLEAALPETGGCNAGRPIYEDFCEEIANALILRGEILISLGRADEGLAAHLSLLSVGRTKNDLLDLMTAARLNVFGHTDEALRILDSPYRDTLSPYWPIAHAEIRACTLANAGRNKELQKEFAFLRAHKAQDPMHLEVAQLCANDLDGAAATLIDMLRSPTDRSEALADLQIYSDVGLAPYSRILRQRAAAVRARRDVQAVLAPVGRVLTYDLQRY